MDAIPHNSSVPPAARFCTSKEESCLARTLKIVQGIVQAILSSLVWFVFLPFELALVFSAVVTIGAVATVGCCENEEIDRAPELKKPLRIHVKAGSDHVATDRADEVLIYFSDDADAYAFTLGFLENFGRKYKVEFHSKESGRPEAYSRILLRQMPLSTLLGDLKTLFGVNLNEEICPLWVPVISDQPK